MFAEYGAIKREFGFLYKLMEAPTSSRHREREEQEFSGVGGADDDAGSNQMVVSYELERVKDGDEDRKAGAVAR